MKKQPVLSLCIPTYNRAVFLEGSLCKLQSQINEIPLDDIEVFISDNASSDNTSDIVQKFIKKGLPITYSRNEINLGFDGNFLSCFKKSHGKYIWLLGDDDYLKPNALKTIVETLKLDDFGLLHLKVNGTMSSTPQIINDCVEFLKSISYYATFISGNIFNRNVLHQLNIEKYMKTCLIQMPLYLEAALTHKKNVIIDGSDILETGVDSDNNGGYNFFEVFVKNYLNIWSEVLKRNNKYDILYPYIKKDLFKSYVLKYIVKLLLLKENVAEELPVDSKSKGFNIDGAWGILIKYYKYEIYFWISISIVFIRRLIGRFVSLIIAVR